uniref:hypothetical protein n=1 Tax=Streptococcus sobrinus TaxID=1310 RepID=UPI0005B62070
MEQEQTVRQVSNIYLRTGEELLKALFYIAAYSYNKAKEHKDAKTFEYSDIKSFKKAIKDPVAFQEFAKSEINLEKLKENLKENGVKFAFQDNPDGTVTMVYRATDDKAIANAAERTLEQIANDPEKVAKDLSKDPKKLTPREQIDKVKKETAKLKSQTKKGVTKKTQSKGRAK